MSDGDHSECPIELLACPEHHGNDPQPESSMFAGALQSVLDDAEVMDDGHDGSLAESKGMTKRKLPAPRLGIFWLVRDNLLFDTTSLSEAERYGDHLTHPRSHIKVWKQLQQLGTAPRESEYEEYPRGRVMFHPSAGVYTILADRCVLDRKDLIARIKEELHLPKSTKTVPDSHYRCFECLYGGEEDDDTDTE